MKFEPSDLNCNRCSHWVVLASGRYTEKARLLCDAILGRYIEFSKTVHLLETEFTRSKNMWFDCWLMGAAISYLPLQ